MLAGSSAPVDLPGPHDGQRVRQSSRLGVPQVPPNDAVGCFVIGPSLLCIQKSGWGMSQQYSMNQGAHEKSTSSAAASRQRVTASVDSGAVNITPVCDN